MAEWACTGCGSANPNGTRFCGQCGEKAPEAVAAAAEQRRLITALFADISGFTPLADRLDPEELLEVIDPIVSALSSIVGRYGGHVEKFAGDALLALFGAPISHDDDAARALHVALEMHAELERIKDELPEDARDLTLHVGINSGHGIARIIGSGARTDYAVLGDAVILAQRLESAAPPGETYVSESTLRLTDHLFELEPIGELTLKGKAEPVRAWRLVGERASTSATRPGENRMVGRDRELAALDDALDRGGVVTVTGEAGVGKSRLLEEAHLLAAQRDVRWLSARCLSYGAALPYWPFMELLRREDAPDDPFVARLLGTGAMETELEPEAFRRGLHDAVVAWLAELAPAVLALEDVHWIDAASQGLIGELVRQAPITLLLSGRSGAEPLFEELAPDRTRVVLTPLDERGVEELIGAQLDGVAPRGLASFIGQRTTGNPFFVQELVRALQESSALVHEDGRWQMRSGWDARSLPPTIEEVLAGRMDALSREAVSTLQAASVIGRRAPRPLLGAIGGDLGAVPELVAGGFVDDTDDMLVFHHALVQDVAYARLLRKQRRDLHRRVAEHAEVLYGAGDDTVDLLARHLYLGGGGPKAVKYLLRAASRARALYANEEAILHLTRCAELIPEDLELRLELADLHELVGEYGRALELYREVRDANSDVRAWRGLAGTHRKHGAYLEALATVDAALYAIDGDRDVAPLFLEGAETLSLLGHTDEAIGLVEVGLESTKDGSTAARLLLELAYLEVASGRYADALEHAEQARKRAEELEHLRGVASALRVAGSAQVRLGQMDAAAATLREGLVLAERVGNIEELGGCLINLGIVELERGDVAAAVACNRRAIEEFERIGHGAGRAWAYSNLAWSLANGGELDEARRYCERTLALSREINHVFTVAEALDTLAFIALEAGATDEAVQHAEEAAVVFLDLGAVPKAAEALSRAAEAWERQGDDERARATRARAREFENAAVAAT